jgi:hypothetical protein
MKQNGQLSENRNDWGFIYGEWSAGQNDFEKAFFVAVQELKERAGKMGADAIIGMRQDIDLDTNAFQSFYLQMYGTAVRYKNHIEIEEEEIVEKDLTKEICPYCHRESDKKYNICEFCGKNKH